jgi:tetratricopeptide (TPR) repeat protein
MLGRPGTGLLALLLALTIAAPARAAETRADLARADSLYASGEFAAADSAYTLAIARDTASMRAPQRRGMIALYRNRLGEAKAFFEKVLVSAPADTNTRRLLAEAYYRGDEFQPAADLNRAVGRNAVADQLASFAGQQPYAITGSESIVEFLRTDPLPVIQMRVNGSDTANFIIDTGAGETIVDTAFAARIGARRFGSGRAIYAAGQTGGYDYGRVDSIRIGDFTVRNVPVQVRDTRAFAAVAGGRRVDGILGTIFLYHFLPTLDYPGGRLILRRRSPAALAAIEQAAAREGWQVVPFWLAGDHLMLASGRINGEGPFLWYVDTGLAGAGFTCPESTLTVAGIHPDLSSRGEGIGGGGRVSIVPFTVHTLTLGPLTEHEVAGFLGPFPPTLARLSGFRVGGLVSHGFLRRYAFTMDFTGMRYFLKRS